MTGLKKFSFEGNLLQVIGKSGSGEGEFRSPSGVARGPEGQHLCCRYGEQAGAGFQLQGDVPRRIRESGKITRTVRRGRRHCRRTRSRIFTWRTGGMTGSRNTTATADSSGKRGKPAKKKANSGNRRISSSHRTMRYTCSMPGTRGFRFLTVMENFSESSEAKARTPDSSDRPRGLRLEEGLRLYVGDRGNKRVQVFILKHTPALPKDVTAQAKIK